MADAALAGAVQVTLPPGAVVATSDGRGRLIAHATTRCFVLRMTIPAPVEDLPELAEPGSTTLDPYQRPAPTPLVGTWGERTFIEVVAAKRRGELPLAFLADMVLTGAVATTLPPRTICSPLDLKVQFVRPVWPDGRRLRATATVAHRGRRFATAHAEIAGEDGTTVALAMSSLVIVEGRSWGSLAVADDIPVERDP